MSKPCPEIERLHTEQSVSHRASSNGWRPVKCDSYGEPSWQEDASLASVLQALGLLTGCVRVGEMVGAEDQVKRAPRIGSRQ